MTNYLTVVTLMDDFDDAAGLVSSPPAGDFVGCWWGHQQRLRREISLVVGEDTNNAAPIGD